LLLAREAASILTPAGTPSPDSAHLIITWPGGVGSRVIGLAFLADGDKERRFIEVVPSRSTTDAEITRVESRTVREPAEAFRLLDEDDGRYGRVVHFAPKVNGPGDPFRDRP
jgi:hypothetical protein